MQTTSQLSFNQVYYLSLLAAAAICVLLVSKANKSHHGSKASPGPPSCHRGARPCFPGVRCRPYSAASPSDPYPRVRRVDLDGRQASANTPQGNREARQTTPHTCGPPARPATLPGSAPLPRGFRGFGYAIPGRPAPSHCHHSTLLHIYPTP